MLTPQVPSMNVSESSLSLPLAVRVQRGSLWKDWAYLDSDWLLFLKDSHQTVHWSLGSECYSDRIDSTGYKKKDYQS